MLNRLKQFFGLSKKAVFAFSLVLVLLVATAVFIPNIAHAQDFAGGIYNGILRLICNMFLGLGKFCISLAIFALKFFIAVAQYNNYLDAPTVQIGWIMVRDVANMFFVVALLMIAFGTILGLENYQWNKTLIKLILSAILINFSNLICGIFIDIAHVFTITFVSAIAGTAGGNLINMFKLDQIFKIANSGAIPSDAKIEVDLLIGSFASFIFALIAALIIGVYALIMLARMVALWVLIILSPLAFIFQVIPQTQQYAKQWWDYFGKYVIAAPVMVFFLWLAFATLGTGDVVSTLNLKLGANELAEITQQSATLEAAGTAPAEQSLSLSAVTTWTNMASFLIPLVLLIVGTKMVEQTGVFGGGMLSKAVDFGKKVATIASGYAAGRWLVGKAGEGAKAAGAGIGKGLLYFTPYAQVKRWGQRQIQGFHAWRRDTGMRPVVRKVIDEETGEEKEVLEYEKVKQGAAQKFFGYFARRDMASVKKLEKTENFAKNREDLLKARTGALPRYFLMRKDEKMDAIDRMEQGMLAAEKMRSQSKTDHYQALAKDMVLSQPRFKDGKFQEGEASMEEQIAHHKMWTEYGEKQVAVGAAEAKKKMVEGEVNFGRLTITTPEGEKRLISGADLIKDMNRMDQGIKTAEEFVKEVQNIDLSKNFEKATGNLKELLKKGLNYKQLRDILEKGVYIDEKGVETKVGLSAYEKSAAMGELTARAVSLQDMNRRKAVDEAADTFINKPLLGDTKPSTVTADFVEKQMPEFRKMERREAMNKAMNVYNHMQNLKDQGFELDMHQKANMDAAFAFLTEEAWLDDGHEDQRTRFKALEGKDEKGWTDEEKNMVNTFSRIGWVKKEGGKLKLLNSAMTYDRKEAQDLQNLGATGGDVELLTAHRAVEKHMDDNNIEHTDENYWKYANEVLKGQQEYGGMKGEKDLKERYEKHQPFLQKATRENTRAGIKTGHGELMYNQNHDKVKNIYRFMTVKEAAGETVAEFAKYPVRKMLNMFQYHHYGRLDQDTAMLDDFEIPTLGYTVGRATRAYEFTDVNERFIKALFYVHKKKNMITEKDKDDGQMYAKMGGEEILTKIKQTDGVDIEDKEAVTKHMLGHNVLRGMLGGRPEGYFLALSQLAKHITEGQAKQGHINLDIMGKKIKTASELIGKLLNLATKDRKYFEEQLKNGKYQGSADDAIAQLKNLQEEYASKEKEPIKEPDTPQEEKSQEGPGKST